MAIELVNIGRIANDGTGDDLREAFAKINRSLEELDLRIDDKTEGVNVGTGAGKIFRRRNGYDLEFKTLVAGNGINLTNNETSIEIKLDDTIGGLAISTENGAFVNNPGDVLTITGGTGVTVTAREQNNSVTIDAANLLADDPTPALGATLNANNNDIINVDTIFANNIESLVYNYDIRELGSLFDNFDFGSIVVAANAPNFLDFIRTTIDVDMGTITSPSSATVDFGPIAV
jgi:hypothetical protein